MGEPLVKEIRKYTLRGKNAEGRAVHLPERGNEQVIDEVKCLCRGLFQACSIYFKGQGFIDADAHLSLDNKIEGISIYPADERTTIECVDLAVGFSLVYRIGFANPRFVKIKDAGGKYYNISYKA